MHLYGWVIRLYRRKIFQIWVGLSIKRLTENLPKVLALVAAGQSYRQIGRQLDLSKNTVLEIVKRERAKVAHD